MRSVRGCTARQRRGFAAALALLACGCGPAPGEAGGGGGSTLHPTHGGRYRVAARPARPPATLGGLHEWVVRVEHSDGRPAAPTRIVFDGGMPAHGHGFVTAPRVTRALGDGEFLVEGVKFHMTGPWELRITVIDARGSHPVAIPVTVEP